MAIGYDLGQLGVRQRMLRYKLKELIGRREFELGRRITIGEVAQAAGIHRMTLSKMINQRGYNTVTDNLDRLCAYFECEVADLVEYVPVETVRQGEAEAL